MTEPELRMAINLLADDEVDQLRINSVTMGEGRTLTIHVGGQLVLTDVVFLDFSVAHLTGLPLARARTPDGGMSVLSMPQIYSLGVVIAAA
jgi:hypothetical protein